MTIWAEGSVRILKVPTQGISTRHRCPQGGRASAEKYIALIFQRRSPKMCLRKYALKTCVSCCLNSVQWKLDTPCIVFYEISSCWPSFDGWQPLRCNKHQKLQESAQTYNFLFFFVFCCPIPPCAYVLSLESFVCKDTSQ